jgi:hypothetical protein
MRIIMQNEYSAVRTAMHGRLLQCALGGNPADCPLYEIRQLPIEERIEWLDSKEDEELMKLFTYHTKCLAEKNHKPLLF